MTVSSADQALQLVAWFLALAELTLALYVLVLNVWHTANRNVSALLLLFAIHNFALGLIAGAGDAGQARLATILLAATWPAIKPGLFIAAVVLLKPGWLQGTWRNAWRLVYGVIFLPVLLTLVDVGCGTRMWYTGLDAVVYAGGHVPLMQYAAGSLSRLVRGLTWYAAPVISLIPLLYVAWRDKEAEAITRRLAWLLLGAQLCGLVFQFALGGLLDHRATEIVTGVVYVVAYGYAGFTEMISARRLQRGRLQPRLTALVLATTAPVLWAVVTFVSARAGVVMSRAAIDHQATGLLAELRQFQLVSWVVLTGAVILSCALVWLTIRQAFQPINVLTEAAAAVAGGDLTGEVPEEGGDEFGGLARTFNDMTEQLREVVGGLTEERNLLRTLIDNLPDPVFVKDAAGQYVIANDAHLRFLGVEAEEDVIGRTDFGVLPRELAERLDGDEQAVVRTGEPMLNREEFLENGTGGGRWTLSTKVPLQDRRGEIVGMVGISRDITGRKRAADALAQQARELEYQRMELAHSNRDLEQFAYVASHDLQEPLRMVRSYVSLLEQRYKGRLDEDADEFIHYAVDGANRMQTLISDVLTYSRVGTQAKPLEPTNCSDLLGEALANLKVAINESQAVVTSDPLPSVMGDGVGLTQVFQNLVGNAIKFREEEPPRISISALQEGDEWIFSVRDNGIGIDPRHTDRIFEIFQRLHCREEYPGTGIGLAICKKVVTRHGGRIWVESELGAGSTFYFTLPAVRQHVDEQSREWQAGQDSAGGGRIGGRLADDRDALGEEDLQLSPRVSARQGGIVTVAL